VSASGVFVDLRNSQGDWIVKTDKNQELVASYKGFDKNLECRGYRFEIGETYTHEGDVMVCESGFHACENPLDVFKYYAPADSRFALVAQSGDISRHESNSKIASRSLTVVREICISELVTAAVEYTLSRVAPAGTESPEWASKDRSLAQNTGSYSAATNTGELSAATNTGNLSTATNTGSYSAATNTGSYSAATNTGELSAATNTGIYGTATNTGHNSLAQNSGQYSAATNTGDRSLAQNTGSYSAATNTGSYSAATNTGSYSAATNTGYQSLAQNTGNYGAALNTGRYSSASAEGVGSVAIAAGRASKAKATEGSAICLVFRDENHSIIHIRASKVGENGIRPDTWYRLNSDGDFVECK
jgi:hypothetical protein